MALGIRCSGKVQGVFYRASTQQIAQKLGVCGWVKNESDGTVFIHAEGTNEQVGKLVEWCKEGPPMAKVDKVASWVEVDQGFKSFEVRH